MGDYFRIPVPSMLTATYIHAEAHNGTVDDYVSILFGEYEVARLTLMEPDGVYAADPYDIEKYGDPKYNSEDEVRVADYTLAEALKKVFRHMEDRSWA